MTRLIRVLILVPISWLVLAGCAPLIRFEQPTNTNFIRLENGKTIGQTFTASYNGLNGVAIYLKPGSSPAGNLELKLFPAVSPDGTAITETILDVAALGEPGYYRFNFSPVDHSTAKDYYLQINLMNGGEILVASGPPESYLNGALYLNGEAEEAQLTFRLAYDRAQALQGLAGEALNWLGLLIAATALFVLPGWGILAWGLPEWDKTWWLMRIGLSAGLSLAIYPILFLWTDLVGLRLGPLYAWLPPIAGLVLIAGRFRRSKLHLPHLTRQMEQIIPNLVAIGLVALLVLTRLWGIRMLLVAMWGDSLQHTMITQLLLDHGGLFDAWQPYSPSTTFTYHFGFHSLAAVLHWMTGLTAEQATLWTGQIVNILAVMALVPLAVRVGRNRWAGVGALLLAGLLFSMPQSYVNWGRFTQLAGQTILPAAAFTGWGLFSKNQEQRWGIALTGLMMAGLALTHYRVLIFGGLFFAVLLVLEFNSSTILRHARRIGLAGVLAGVIFLPWFMHVFGGRLLAIFSSQISTPASQVIQALQESNTVGNIFSFLPPVVWILLPVVVAWGLWRREKGVAIIAIWWFLNLLAANPGWLNLPGTGVIGSFSVLIAFYFPAAILLGAAVGWWMDGTYQIKTIISFSPGNSRLWIIFLGLLALGIGLRGAADRIDDFKPMEGVLFTRPDRRAVNWIKTNVPPEAVFLVNSFYVPQWNLVVGSDGGWWLPLEANRETTQPPITYTTEEAPFPGYIEWVNHITLALAESGFDDPEVRKLLDEHGVTHIYIGQRQGSVNNPGPVIDVGQLIANPDLIPVYHQDRVWIFQVLPNG